VRRLVVSGSSGPLGRFSLSTSWLLHIADDGAVNGVARLVWC
jgi:hypothetical protein